MIKVGNGPKLISHEIDLWCRKLNIEFHFIQPGKPMQSGFVERCHKNIRRERLHIYVFTLLQKVKEKAEEWRRDYNGFLPHKLLGYVPTDGSHKSCTFCKTYNYTFKQHK
jgi:putative transposase